MTEDEFWWLAAAYGGDLARWPKAVQREAAALARCVPHLREVLQAELAFDERLREAAPEVTAAREDAVMEAALNAIARSPAAAAGRQSHLRRAIPAALAVCAIAGFALGFSVAPRLFHPDGPPDVFAFLSGDGGGEGFLSR